MNRAMTSVQGTFFFLPKFPGAEAGSRRKNSRLRNDIDGRDGAVWKQDERSAAKAPTLHARSAARRETRDGTIAF